MLGWRLGLDWIEIGIRGSDWRSGLRTGDSGLGTGDW